MSIEMEEYPRDMSLVVLAEKCMCEINVACRKEAYDDWHWTELLRRATVQHDHAARQVVWHHLGQVIQMWLCCHPEKELACRLKNETYYVTQTCKRFWQAIMQQELASTRLSAVLLYIRVCLNSVILDALRTHEYTATILLLESVGQEKAAADHQKDSEAWWEHICEILPTEREQRVAYLLFHCGLRPNDIVRLCPKEFSDCQEISRVRHTVIRRLLASEITTAPVEQMGASKEAAD